MVHPARIGRLDAQQALGQHSELQIAKKALPYQSLEVWPSNNTSDRSTLELATSWLTTCPLDHPGCFPASELRTWHPPRLVHIGTSNEPVLRLVIGDDIPDDVMYFSLSHCWGAIEIFKLLTTDIEELRAIIPFHKLSRTFQEAIEV